MWSILIESPLVTTLILQDGGGSVKCPRRVRWDAPGDRRECVIVEVERLADGAAAAIACLSRTVTEIEILPPSSRWMLPMRLGMSYLRFRNCRRTLWRRRVRPVCRALANTIRNRPEWQVAVETADRLSRTVHPRWPHDATKFLNLDHWLEVNLERAAKLGLMDTPGLKVLDLGSGTGQFLFLCDTLGHQAIGVDLPREAMKTPEREIFTEMPEAFGVRVIRGGISSFQPLTVEGNFDLITSFMVCFNNLKTADEWMLAEWKFFVEDALGRLNPGGRLALRLNLNEEKFGPSGYFDRETHAFFASIGTIHDCEIMISRDPILF